MPLTVRILGSFYVSLVTKSYCSIDMRCNIRYKRHQALITVYSK